MAIKQELDLPRGRVHGHQLVNRAINFLVQGTVETSSTK